MINSWIICPQTLYYTFLKLISEQCEHSKIFLCSSPGPGNGLVGTWVLVQSHVQRGEELHRPRLQESQKDWRFNGSFLFLKPVFYMNGDVVHGFSRMHSADSLVFRMDVSARWCLWQAATCLEAIGIQTLAALLPDPRLGASRAFVYRVLESCCNEWISHPMSSLPISYPAYVYIKVAFRRQKLTQLNVIRKLEVVCIRLLHLPHGRRNSL